MIIEGENMRECELANGFIKRIDNKRDWEDFDILFFESLGNFNGCYNGPGEIFMRFEPIRSNHIGLWRHELKHDDVSNSHGHPVFSTCPDTPQIVEARNITLEELIL